MRMLKVFIAYDATDKIISAKQHQPASQQKYFCKSCGCPLIWCNNLNGKPWFSHDLSRVPVEQLRGCAYYDSEVKSNERLAKLRNMVNRLARVVPIRHWPCRYNVGISS